MESKEKMLENAHENSVEQIQQNAGANAAWISIEGRLLDSKKTHPIRGQNYLIHLELYHAIIDEEKANLEIAKSGFLDSIRAYNKGEIELEEFLSHLRAIRPGLQYKTFAGLFKENKQDVSEFIGKICGKGVSEDLKAFYQTLWEMEIEGQAWKVRPRPEDPKEYINLEEYSDIFAEIILRLGFSKDFPNLGGELVAEQNKSFEDKAKLLIRVELARSRFIDLNAIYGIAVRVYLLDLLAAFKKERISTYNFDSSIKILKESGVDLSGQLSEDEIQEVRSFLVKYIILYGIDAEAAKYLFKVIGAEGCKAYLLDLLAAFKKERISTYNFDSSIKILKESGVDLSEQLSESEIQEVRSFLVKYVRSGIDTEAAKYLCKVIGAEGCKAYLLDSLAAFKNERIGVDCFEGNMRILKESGFDLSGQFSEDEIKEVQSFLREFKYIFFASCSSKFQEAFEYLCKVIGAEGYKAYLLGSLAAFEKGKIDEFRVDMNIFFIKESGVDLSGQFSEDEIEGVQSFLREYGSIMFEDTTEYLFKAIGAEGRKTYLLGCLKMCREEAIDTKEFFSRIKFVVESDVALDILFSQDCLFSQNYFAMCREMALENHNFELAEKIRMLIDIAREKQAQRVGGASIQESNPQQAMLDSLLFMSSAFGASKQRDL